METPENLHRLQYAQHILEEVLGWPAKGNVELVADCVLSISKVRHLSLQKAHDYMARAIKLAREQQIEIDRFWFMEGQYLNIRPESKTALPYKKLDRAATEAEQNTPEFLELSNLARKKLRELAGMKDMSLATHTKDELKAQVGRLQK